MKWLGKYKLLIRTYLLYLLFTKTECLYFFIENDYLTSIQFISILSRLELCSQTIWISGVERLMFFQFKSNHCSSNLDCHFLFLNLELFLEKNQGAEFTIVICKNILPVYVFYECVQTRYRYIGNPDIWGMTSTKFYRLILCYMNHV